MTSTAISKVSAILLLIGGIAFLFAADATLPLLAPGVPPSAMWLGELIGAGWLAVAALNWLSRSSVLGGVYGRPIVAANLALFFITAMVSIRIAIESSGNDVPWLIAVPCILFSAIYAWLLLRGPLERDMRSTP
jgi:hypothetical protein